MPVYRFEPSGDQAHARQPAGPATREHGQRPRAAILPGAFLRRGPVRYLRHHYVTTASEIVAELERMTDFTAVRRAGEQIR